MRGSTAFEEIHDPHDPAWGGQGVDGAHPRPIARAAWIVLAIVLASALVAGGVTALAGGGSDASGQAPGEPRRTVLPAVAPASGTDALAPLEAPPEPVAATGPAAPVGSGWAPEVATKPSWSSRWLEGDLAGVSPAVTGRLETVARQLGRKIEVISGWRTTHEQADLYQRYKAGTGNLAAVPGTSMHESGRAADVYVDGVALANVSGATAIAASVGLHFPVGGEPWHVELMD